MNKKTIKDIEVGGKRVLVRCDFNVPLDKGTGDITNDSRIRASVPTINYLINKKAKVILCSHLGQPKAGYQKEFGLEPVSERLEDILQHRVKFVHDCVGPQAESAVAAMKAGDVVLLENLRFHAGEEKNELNFAKELASLAEIYVNDAFSTSHRTHASIVGVAGYLPAVAGLLMEKELATMGKALNSPIRPFCVILGGAKVSDKIGLIENIISKVDILLIGGGIANTFLKARNNEVGASIVETEKLGVATELMEKARKNAIKLLLPVDVVVAEKIAPNTRSKTVSLSEIPDQWQIGDIGPKTVEAFSRELHKAKTVIWNGPMGVYEIPQLSAGTKSIANALAGLDAITIVGGGSTAEVVEDLKLEQRMTHVSTGGGASLAFLEGKVLVGVSPLMEK